MMCKSARLSGTPIIRSCGLALVELMISLVLGLVIIGAVTGIMLSNLQGFNSNRAMTQVQDAARIGFELLARDIRQAGNVPCGNDIPIVNILNPAQSGTVLWQYDWDNAVKGFDGGTALPGVSNQISGTEWMVMLSGQATNVYVDSFDPTNASFEMASSNPAGHSLRGGDILMVCNERLGTIFQMKLESGGEITSSRGGSMTPGNCSDNFGEFFGACTTAGVSAPYGANSVVSQLSATAWYVGDNGRPDEGGRSLYMVRLANNSGNAVLSRVEIASGITDLSFRYRLVDTATFVDSDSVTSDSRWGDVNAVQITMTLQSQDKNVTTSTSTNEGRLGRTFTSVVAIRSRS